MGMKQFLEPQAISGLSLAFRDALWWQSGKTLVFGLGLQLKYWPLGLLAYPPSATVDRKYVNSGSIVHMYTYIRWCRICIINSISPFFGRFRSKRGFLVRDAQQHQEQQTNPANIGAWLKIRGFRWGSSMVILGIQNEGSMNQVPRWKLSFNGYDTVPYITVQILIS